MKARTLFAGGLIGSFLLISFVLLAGSLAPVNAQVNRRSRIITPKPTPPPEPAPLSTPAPAKSKSRKLPEAKKYANYCAVPFFFCPDPGEIQTVLLENNDKLSKGKFEKTAEWDERKVHLLYDIRLTDDQTMASEMTFLYTQGTDASEWNEPVYDADKEQWTFALRFQPGLESTTCLPLVTRKYKRLVCLVVETDISNVIAAQVDMPISAAQENDGALQIAFVGRVVVKDVHSHKFKVWGFFFDLTEMICINPKTGESWKVKYVYPKPDPAPSAKRVPDAKL